VFCAALVQPDRSRTYQQALLESTALRRFVGFDLNSERVHGGTILLKFRHLLAQHQLGEQLFARIGLVLQPQDPKVGHRFHQTHPHESGGARYTFTF
jgi:IS5 family transposase